MNGLRANTVANLRRQIQAIESGGADSTFCQNDLSNSSSRQAHHRSTEAKSTVAGNDHQQAFERIECLVSHRDRSEQEVISRLSKEGFQADAIQQAVQRAKRCLLIDDLRFADAFIRARLRAGKGNRAIERDLRGKGIDPSALPSWPHEYLETSTDSQLERAVALLEKQPPRSKNPLQSAYAKLVRKGYDSAIAKEAALRWFRSEFD